MTAEIIAYMAFEQDMKRRMEFSLVTQCAPFLKGMRTASVLNVEQVWVGGLHRLFETTDISWQILVARKERCLVLFYRKSGLERVLSVREVRQFLKGYGYEAQALSRSIARLSMRMNLYVEGKIDFPHELGIFLDYPLEDVRAFIKNGGRKSIFTGYWKVYHNPGRAHLTFLAYDKAKDSAVNEFLAGKDISEIVKAG